MNHLLAAAVSLIAAFVISGTAYAQEDITPPTLLDVQFEPQSVDTTKGPQVITVTIHIVDDLSGFKQGGLKFRHQATEQMTSAYFALPIKGLDGEHYRDTFTLPQYSALGEWELYSIYFYDRVGNRLSMVKPNEEKALQSSDWPALFNGFVFAVGSSGQQEFRQNLFLPLAVSQ